MQEHPFIRVVPYRITAVAMAALLTGIYTVSLVWYGKLPVLPALAESIAGILLLSAAGFWVWYVTGVLHSIPAQAILALTAVTCSLAGSLAIAFSFAPSGPGHFVYTLPFRFAYCLGAWIILLQWYRIYQATGCEENVQVPGNAVVASPVAPEGNKPERISVKDGTRIHILQPGEVLYIQACGDYVTLFTANAQYLKEQTMKQLEEQLAPAGFVRIHRSVLVNIQAILRIELFGKETYLVRLKNNVSVRASAPGYKLLKERLAL
ncbi:MAG: LytTR family transcriptional regulator [Parabacteroides sp.]|nr:LytTR family transcriptional regulator [Parabacteroides sp.]